MTDKERIMKLEKEVDILKNIIYSTIAEKPTKKQLEVVNFIEDNLKIEFKGGTKQDAQEFVSKYIKESKKVHKDTKSIDL